MTAPLSPAPALTAEEAARVAVFDAAEEPEEVVVERVARAIGEAWITSGPRAWEEQSEGRRQGARHLAAVAIAAMPASPTGEAEEGAWDLIEWCVFAGGEHPDDAALRLDYDDEGSACEMLQWMPDAGIARRVIPPPAWTVVRAAALDANPAPEPVAHNHTRFRNDGGPWSPCPVSCPAAGLLR